MNQQLSLKVFFAPLVFFSVNFGGAHALCQDKLDAVETIPVSVVEFEVFGNAVGEGLANVIVKVGAAAGETGAGIGEAAELQGVKFEGDHR